MEFILNDYSLNGQFKDLEEFINWFNIEFKNILDYLICKKIPLLKKSDFYSRNITKEKTLSDVLKISGDPLVYQIKSYISKMAFTEPYWDKDPKTIKGIDYKCLKYEDIPNCFTEAIERGKVLLSIKNKEFESLQITFQRQDVNGVIENIFTYIHFLKWLLVQKDSDKKYIFENYQTAHRIIFPLVNKRCYAAEAINNNELNDKDKLKILENIPRMAESLQKGEKNRFWDFLVDGIYEYRVSISQGREFRLLFFQNGKIYFLNGFIKKTPKTPKVVIDEAKKLKREIEKTLFCKDSRI